MGGPSVKNTATIYDIGAPGRGADAQHPPAGDVDDLPGSCLRETPPWLPQASELQVVRHYTNLSARNFSIDTQFYPLGSCTMKYNPRGAHRAGQPTRIPESTPLGANGAGARAFFPASTTCSKFSAPSPAWPACR